MNLSKKVATYLAFVVLAAILISVLAPKATHALVATLVQVANTSANPVPTSDVNNPDRATILILSCQSTSTVTNTVLTCDPGSKVPAGQRLVIDRVEADCSKIPGTVLGESFISLTEGGNSTRHVLPMNTPETGINTEYVLSQQVRYSADAGSSINFFAETTDTAGGAECDFQADGYLVNYP
jgi:hypothetical protein